MSMINADFRPQPSHSAGSAIQAAVKKDAYRVDILDLIKRKFWFIQFFVLVGILLSLLYYFKVPKTYQSTARIFVDERKAPSMNTDGDSFANDTSIEQYQITLKSTKILEPAIEDGKFYDMQTFAESDDILFALREGELLTAKSADVKSNSGVIKLAFKGRYPEECQEVLQTIVNSFDLHIKDTTRNIGGETAKLVTKMQDEMLNRLSEVEAEIQTLMIRPEILNVNGQIVNPHQVQLNMMLQSLNEIRRERITLTAREGNLRKDLATGANLKEITSQLLRESEEILRPGSAARSQLVGLRMTEQELLNEYGAAHPEVRKVQKQISVISQMVDLEMAASQASSLVSGDSQDYRQIVSDFADQLARQNLIMASEEVGLQTSIKEEQELSTSVSAIVENLNTLQRERERLEKGYYAVVERLGEINAMNEHLWRTLSVLDPPSAAEKIAPSLPLSLAAGLFLGSLAGLGFAGFKDIAEKTFHSSEDVADLLGTRVIGHVGMFMKTRRLRKNDPFPNIQPEVVSLHTPAAPSSEAYRSIRTSIFFKAQETSAKIIQVTSPTPGDGKSTTASNLAASIAQSGRRVLLMDADMRKPVQHKLFGLTNDVGLSSIISGDAEAADAINVVLPEYFSVMPAGPMPSNPAELLTSVRFASLLDKLRESFDFILVDSPPMLAVTDPSIICGHVDQVYMVMRIRNGVRTNALRAKEIIDSMGIQLGGVIINGLRRRDHKTYEYTGKYGYGGGTYGGSYGNNYAKNAATPPAGNGVVPTKPGRPRVGKG